jgi:anaerobic selenocysteine-containing dehydrogenase
LRELHKDPIVEIHPDTAAKEGIQEGDWVIIESCRGKVRQWAKLTVGLGPRIVSAQHAWWFPEKKDPKHGWDESNINILTEDDLEGMDPAMGASNLKTALCRIYPEKKQGVSCE